MQDKIMIGHCARSRRKDYSSIWCVPSATASQNEAQLIHRCACAASSGHAA